MIKKQEKKLIFQKLIKKENILLFILFLLWLNWIILAFNLIFQNFIKISKVKEEKVYVLRKCNCKDFIRFRQQYRIGILVDKEGNLCNLKCK